MKRFKKVIMLAAVLAMVISMSAGAAFAQAAPAISIDGTALKIDANMGAPYIDSANRTQVPIRAFVEGLGSNVVWDQPSQIATIDGNIKITVGSSDISTPYGIIKMDTQAVSKNGRIYVPARFVAKALGFDIEASDKSGVMKINVPTKVDLTISAAASLKDALTDIQALYKKAKPGTTIAINFGGSGALQQQIEQGAPADIFFSAAKSNVTALKDKGLLVDDSIKNLLKNTLVLVVPSDSKSKIDSFEEVTDKSIAKIALGEPTTVPAGKYATQVFTYYKIQDAVAKKAVYGKDVKEVLTWVESGNVDAGVVYSTDAKTSDKVKVIATAAAESHDSIIYPAAVVKASEHTVAAEDFVNFLSSDAAKAVFVKYGFGIL
jgi:molybdate transport system substrate-binding protein